MKKYKNFIIGIVLLVSGVFIVLALFSTTDFQAQHNALDFDGVDDYLSFSNTSGQFEATGDFTFEAWVKWSTLYTGQMSPIFGGQQHAYVSLYNGSKSIRIASNGTCSGDRNFGPSDTITTNEWHHIAVVRSGSTISR